MLQSGRFLKKASVACQHRMYASLKGMSICIPHVWSRQAMSITNPDSFARWLKSPTVNFLETSTNTRSPALPQSQNIHCHMLLVILWNALIPKEKNKKKHQTFGLSFTTYIPAYLLHNGSFLKPWEIKFPSGRYMVKVHTSVGGETFSLKNTWCELGVGGA